MWRERAQMLRDFGGDRVAVKIWELAATELDQALRNWSHESLNLTDAARLSGYTAAHLSALIREGKIPNAGPHDDTIDAVNKLVVPVVLSLGVLLRQPIKLMVLPRNKTI